MRTRSRSAENRRHHAIRQGRSEGRFTTPPADLRLRWSKVGSGAKPEAADFSTDFRSAPKPVIHQSPFVRFDSSGQQSMAQVRGQTQQIGLVGR